MQIKFEQMKKKCFRNICFIIYPECCYFEKKKTSPSVHIIKISDTKYSKFGENGELLQFTYKQLKLKSNLLEDNYQTKNEKDNKCLIC